MGFSKTEKTILIIEAIIIVILSLACIFLGEFAHLYYDYIEPIKNEEFHNINDEYHIYVEDILDPKYEIAIVSKIEYYVKKAPLYKNNYYFILTGDCLESGVEYVDKHKETVGTTNKNKQIIRINYDYIDYAIMHEIGHAVDNTYGFTKTKEFLELYNKVKPESTDYIATSLDEYMLLDIKEYFAENYSRFVDGTLTNPELIEYFQGITGILYMKQDIFQAG